ncbi:MAG: hypothetical protein AB7P52_17675 [Alphaproteobacteria bacterium]
MTKLEFDRLYTYEEFVDLIVDQFDGDRDEARRFIDWALDEGIITGEEAH